MATNLRESYELLGLPTNATEEEVRKAYKQKARECHPDKNPDDPQATEKFQALRQGYERIVSGSSEEPDNGEHFSGFDSFFHFVIFREMMRRRMREEMMARMFGGLFDDDSDLDEDDFPFAAFGRPFFHRSRHHESSARSQNFRSREQGNSRYGTSSYERGSSAKTPPKKPQRDRKKKPSYPDRSGNSDRPKQAQSQGNNSSKQKTTFDSDREETTKSKYGQEDCNAERETYREERGKPTGFAKSKQKNKTRSQMTASEWQKGRKSKKNHKKKQTAKSSSSSPFKTETREEIPDSDIESETSVKRGQQFPQQTARNRKEQEEHTCSSSPNSEEWTPGNTKKSEGDFNGDRARSRHNSDQGNHFDRAFSFTEFEDTGEKEKENVSSNETTTESLDGDRNSAETGDKPIKHADNCDEEDGLKNVEKLKDGKFPQEGENFMFDDEVGFKKTRQSNLSKDSVFEEEDSKINLNIKTSKGNENEVDDNYKAEQEVIHLNTKGTHAGQQTDKAPPLTQISAEMKQETVEENPSGRQDNPHGTASTASATINNKTFIPPTPGVSRVQKDEKDNVKPAFVKTTKVQKPCNTQSKQETVEENPGGRQDNPNGTASTASATINNKTSIPTPGVNRVQKDEKDNVKPAFVRFVKTTKVQKPCNTQSKQERREGDGRTKESYNKNDEWKMARSSEKINAGIRQTENTETHADRPEQRIPQKKETGHHGEVCQDGANPSKLHKPAGHFSGKKTGKNKYDGKSKSQSDGYPKLGGKSCLHELQSDSKETQKLTGNTSNRRNRSETNQELKAEETTESQESSVNSSMTSCNDTTENDNLASGCSSNVTPKQEFVFERAEPTIAYRKAPLDDELKQRRPSKHEKRQERRQRRVNDLLSGNM